MTQYVSKTSATIIRNPSTIPHWPEYGLFGRQDDTKSVGQYLARRGRVMLTGEAGIGKSALAATLAATFLAENHDAILWLTLGDSSAAVLFEAMARPFGQQRLMASVVDSAPTQFLHHLLAKSDVRCIVLDDAQTGNGLLELLPAIPANIPLIITARHAIKALDLPTQHLLPLHLADSVQILQACAGRFYSEDEQNSIEELCQLLAGNPYLLRVVGKTLASTTITPEETLDMISYGSTPLVENVVEFALSTLNEDELRVLRACGAFFEPVVTAELISLYRADVPKISDLEIADVHAHLPTTMTADNVEIRDFLMGQAVLALNLDTEAVIGAIQTLEARGLVEIMSASEENVIVYRLHDVVFDYLDPNVTDENKIRAVNTCLMLLRRHNEPRLENFVALEPIVLNLQKAAEWSIHARRYAAAERFAWDLFANSQFLDYYGYYDSAKQLLTIAAQAAEKLRKPARQAAHLHHLGLCQSDTGDYDGAATAFQHAATLFHLLGDAKSEVTTLAELGDTYRCLRYFDQAIEVYQHVLQLSLDLHDPWGQSRALANLGRSYRRMGHYPAAIDHIEQSLAISRGMVDLGGESNMLRYLGNIYRETGDLRAAIDNYMQALTIARDINDRKLEANILGNLGNVYANLDQPERAEEYYQQAHGLYVDIDDPDGIVEITTKLAHLALRLKHFDKALDHFEEIREISTNRGDIRQEAVAVWSMATVYESMGQLERAKAYFNEVQALYDVLALGTMKPEHP